MKVCWDTLNLLASVKFNGKKGGWFFTTGKSNQFLYIHDEVCIICGDPFIGAKNVKTCSVECGRKYQGQTQVRKVPHKRKVIDTMSFTCSFCGRECLGSNSYRNHERCCSRNENRYVLPRNKGGHKGSNQYTKAKAEGRVYIVSEESKEKWRESNRKRAGVPSGVASFNRYAVQLERYEAVRRAPENGNVLQVECYYCKEWITPSVLEVQNRIQSIKKTDFGENHFYHAGRMCRSKCSIYGKHTNTVDVELDNEISPEISQIVRQRANGICERCKETPGIHCHHTEPRKCTGPMLEADVDQCLWVCLPCHLDCHQKDGCSTGYLANAEFDETPVLA